MSWRWTFQFICKRHSNDLRYNNFAKLANNIMVEVFLFFFLNFTIEISLQKHTTALLMLLSSFVNVERLKSDLKNKFNKL